MNVARSIRKQVVDFILLQSHCWRWHGWHGWHVQSDSDGRGVHGENRLAIHTPFVPQSVPPTLLLVDCSPPLA